MSDSDKQTHFGYQTVNESEKAGRVAQVFHSVAKNYDLMNDVMSGGLHRLWKHFTINTAYVPAGGKVLDIAGGTGDLSRGWAKKVGRDGEVWLTDINSSMLGVGRDRLLNEGLVLPVAVCDAEKLPFPDDYFDLVSVSFGLRNMTHKDIALQEMRRVLKPGGTLLRPGNAQADDARCRLCPRRLPKPDRRRRRPAQRREIRANRITQPNGRTSLQKSGRFCVFRLPENSAFTFSGC